MLETAIRAARRAGAELLSAWGGRLEVLAEDGNDVKLEMDCRAEAIIMETIREAYPDHGFLCEESGETVGESEIVWVVDPLDGTHNYFRGLPFWCTCVGATRRGTPVVGVIYDPVHEHLYTAEAGRGAFLNGEPIRVSDRESLPRALVAYGIYHGAEGSTRAWERRAPVITPRVRSVRNLGSAGLHCAYVASGALDAFLQYGVSPWDVTAGFALVTEAGGSVHCRELGNGGLDVLVATPGVHAELMGLGLWDEGG